MGTAPKNKAIDAEYLLNQLKNLDKNILETKYVQEKDVKDTYTATDENPISGKGVAVAVNTLQQDINRKSNIGHKHTKSEITDFPTSMTPTAHTHDDRYYTETEMNTKLNGKANSSHTHGNGDITSLDASKITSGTISIDRLPQGALERLTVVADDTARFKLTSSTIQKGDTVKVTSTGKMYYVVDETKLSTEAGYEVYAAGTAASVPWSGVTGKPSTYTPSSHTHTKSQITDFPSSLPANGGNSATVNGHTVNSDVPSGAKFTDTTYNDATTSAHGLMTPAMVSKLNGIADGANKTIVDSALDASSENPVQNKVIAGEINTLKKSVSDGKTKVANAITDKGVETATDATFDVMAENISKIETGGGELHGATLAVSTSDSELFGQTVTLTFNGASVGSTVFADNGTCSFVVQNPGTYAITCGEIRKSVIVTGDNVLNKTVISVELFIVKIVAFATGTDEEIADMIEAHYNNKINIANYWAVGDIRTVHLSAMDATGVNESHREQDVQFVIGDFEHDDLTTPINGHTKAAITLLQKDCLCDALNAVNPIYGVNNKELGHIDRSSAIDNWKECARRTWCNNVYFNALPTTWKSMVKTVNKKAAVGNYTSTMEIVQDKIFLAAGAEIFSKSNNSYRTEGTQYQYYKNATANRYKMPKWTNDEVSSVYWLRSPYGGPNSGFCKVKYDGSEAIDETIALCALAPCACI